MTSKKFTDYFALLEITPATPKEGIKKAFMAKALVFHPDKANSPAEKKSFGKIYEDLQNAYRILSSETSRKQYLDSNQKSNLDLIRENRDVTYKHVTAIPILEFNEAFNAARDPKEQEKYAKMRGLAKTPPVSQHEVNTYIEQRDKDTIQMKLAMPPASGPLKQGQGQIGQGQVQVYTEPLGYIGGVDELANISLSNGSFEGISMDMLIGHNDISGSGQFNTDENCPVPVGTLESRIKLIQQERENYRNLAQTDFKIIPSEIEIAYAELFKPVEMEGLTRT